LPLKLRCDNAGVFDAVKPRLVLGGKRVAALQFVQSGAADVGIVALSLALAPTVVSTGRYWVVPLDNLSPHGAGRDDPQGAVSPDAARQFRSFLLSAPARAVLKAIRILPS